MKNKKQSIGCNVSNCTYNDSKDEKCTLDEIKIKCSCDDATEKEETICDSFDCNCGCQDNEKE